MVVRAPIFSNLSRIVPHCALAISVPCKPKRRKAKATLAEHSDADIEGRGQSLSDEQKELAHLERVEIPARKRDHGRRLATHQVTVRKRSDAQRVLDATAFFAPGRFGDNPDDLYVSERERHPSKHANAAFAEFLFAEITESAEWKGRR